MITWYCGIGLPMVQRPTMMMSVKIIANYFRLLSWCVPFQRTQVWTAFDKNDKSIPDWGGNHELGPPLFTSHSFMRLYTSWHGYIGLIYIYLYIYIFKYKLLAKAQADAMPFNIAFRPIQVQVHVQRVNLNNSLSSVWGADNIALCFFFTSSTSTAILSIIFRISLTCKSTDQ